MTHQATVRGGPGRRSAPAATAGRTLALFLGSNIGNFDPPGADAFLRNVRAALAPGDALLLGTDLVKPEAELLLAYDDPLGVTAAFNRNLLVRVNRELGADFDVDAVRAIARSGTRTQSRIEMHLVSTAPSARARRGVAPRHHLRSRRDDLDGKLLQVPPRRRRAHAGALRFRRVTQWIDDVEGSR